MTCFVKFLGCGSWYAEIADRNEGGRTHVALGIGLSSGFHFNFLHNDRTDFDIAFVAVRDIAARYRYAISSRRDIDKFGRALTSHRTFGESDSGVSAQLYARGCTARSLI